MKRGRNLTEQEVRDMARTKAQKAAVGIVDNCDDVPGNAAPAREVGVQPPRAVERQPNKTERRFRDEAHQLGQGFYPTDTWTYEALRFRIGRGRRYTPDWVVMSRSVTNGIEHVMPACVEVKGSRKAVNARDGITRLHVAAEMWPMFRWCLAERVDGGWKVQWLN